jgi:hypothetical protein
VRFWALVLLWGCGPNAPILYGAAAPDLQESAVDLDSALQSDAHEAVVRGTIGQVCDQGCWFYLLGAKGLVYVKLDLGAGLVIPVGSKGKQAVVSGRFQGKGAERKLLGQSILIY